MTDHDRQTMQKTLMRYNQLSTQRDNLRAALEKMQQPALPGAGYAQADPFTGNTRETRRVEALRLWFSPTSGGAPSVELLLNDLNLSAWEFGKALEKVLQDHLLGVLQAIEEL